MNIAYLITTLSYGGAERQLLALCKGLKHLGHRVQVGCLKEGGELIPEFLSHNIPVSELRMKPAIDPGLFYRVRGWLKHTSFDLLHTQLFKADLYGGLAARSLGIPTICTRQNNDPYLQNPVVGRIAKYLAERCDRMIAISEATRNYFQKSTNFQSPSFEVIRMGIPLSNGLHATGTHYGASIRFGVAARLAKQKGHEVLLEAFDQAAEKTDRIELLIFGNGPLEEKLRHQALGLRSADKIKFCGLVLDTDRIFSEIDVCVLPSLWEGAPLVLLESMARGVPVVATSVGGVPELVHQGCGLLVPPNHVEALRDAILTITDANIRAAMAERCKEKIHEFDFEHTLQAHIRLYEDCLAEHL